VVVVVAGVVVLVVVTVRVVLVLGRVVVVVRRFVVVLGRVVELGLVVELASGAVVVTGCLGVTGNVVVPGWGPVGGSDVFTGLTVVVEGTGRELVAPPLRDVGVVGSAGNVVAAPVVLVLRRTELVDGRLPPLRDREVGLPGPVIVSPFDLVTALERGPPVGRPVFVLRARPWVVDVAAADGTVVEPSVVVAAGVVVDGAVVVAARGGPAGVVAKWLPGRAPLTGVPSPL
jgi:hypothetical protein